MADFRAALVTTGAAVDRADRNPVAVYLSTMGSKQSRETQLAALGNMAALLLGKTPAEMGTAERAKAAMVCPWWELRYQHVQRLRGLLVETPVAGTALAPATVNRHLAALRRVLKECWRLGLMTAEDYHRARDVPPVTAVRLPKGRMISVAELGAMVRAAAALGPRDTALLALMFYSGMRRAEVASLTMASFVDGGRALRVTGKGNKERLIPLEQASAQLDAWIAVRGRAPGPLFPNRSGKHMTPQAVYFLLKRIADAAGVTESLSPHDMRRTFGSSLLDAGVDLVTVQKLFGHASPTTTARYDRRDEEAARTAIKKLRTL